MRKNNVANGFEFVNSNSLQSQIEEVKKSSISRDAKAASLLALGLLEKEVQLFLDAPVKVRAPRHTFTYTFGVEIECTHAPRPRLMQAVQSKGVGIFSYVGCYAGCHTDNHPNRFKIVSDGSLTGADCNEVVSPVLGSRGGFASLKKVCESLKEIGARVNKSCGLHVHIGAADLTDEQYCNVFKNYHYLQGVIDSFMAPSRRNSRWCRNLDGDEIIYCVNRYQIKQACNFDRYLVVNPMAYDRHRTIEFRQHQGSTDFTKIQNWVKFCAKLVDWSKGNVLTAPIASVDEIPFLTATEKRFFKSRQAAFMRQAA